MLRPCYRWLQSPHIVSSVGPGCGAGCTGGLGLGRYTACWEVQYVKVAANMPLSWANVSCLNSLTPTLSDHFPSADGEADADRGGRLGSDERPACLPAARCLPCGTAARFTCWGMQLRLAVT